VIDVTDRLLSLLSAERVPEGLAQDREGFVPSGHPQAALMFAKLAAHRSEEIEKVALGFDDVDHAVNFQALATCLSNYIDPGVAPSFEEAARPDEAVVDFYGRQLMEDLNRHQAACLYHGLWRIYYDPDSDRFHTRLTRRRRRSALLVINNLAQIEALDAATGGLLSSGIASDDDVFFAFASSAEHLRFVREADPKSWGAFAESAGFTSDSLTAFAAFLVFLDFAADQVGHSLWYDQPKLLTLCGIFREAFSCESLPDGQLAHLLDLFSLPPQAAADWSLPVPFFRIGDRYLRYKGFIGIMSPSMGLLTIAIRKHEAAWSRTVGSTLARAADVLAASLPPFDRMRVAVRRGVKGKGDIDLALYDSVSGHLLICEVKTVYDKHRTVRQMRQFEDAKVRLSHAVNQLRTSIAAVSSGDLSMTSIFGCPLPPPTRIDGALLTWFDPIDLTMGSTDEDLFSVNFATFRYMLRRSEGDLPVMLRAVTELRNVWCVAIRRLLDLGQPEIDSDLEVQVSVVDAASDIDRLGLSPLAVELVRQLPALPENWRDSPETAGTAVSYLKDTVQVLTEA
jgi:hypothetical protein